MTRDQFLTEKVLRECWHEWPTITQDLPSAYALCKKCYLLAHNGFTYESNNNFSTPEGFFKLWDYCKEQEWWKEFLSDYWHFTRIDHLIINNLISKLINPDTFANEIAQYRGWKEKK
jgi:hypothetical protein